MNEHTVKPKNIKPEDEVTITVTYRDLAKIYALIGSSTCRYMDENLYLRLMSMLDSGGDIRYNIVYQKVPRSERLDYAAYQEEFEAALFPQEPTETEQQKQIRELRERAEALQEQSKILLQKTRSLEENQK